MKEIPTMFRTELYHAVSVHFPIAILCLCAIITILYLIFRNNKIGNNLRFTVSILLLFGYLSFWIAYYTGKNAYPMVVREICDPSVLKNHLYWVYVSGYFFGGALICDMIYNFNSVKKLKFYFNIITSLLILSGTGFLAYAGHLGAEVVYQQAGGVYIPDEKCREF
ncbi:hypothetical protein [Chryseobacterium echinoideorum]|uniref:hypothetical protein n=1 Tax=Chryseobacterium echinoideorum TaxID=1549648 RepID=UPI001185C19A|nr:hypothetical protein [Chryseobacterium echinoideorum]